MRVASTWVEQDYGTFGSSGTESKSFAPKNRPNLAPKHRNVSGCVDPIRILLPVTATTVIAETPSHDGLPRRHPSLALRFPASLARPPTVTFTLQVTYYFCRFQVCRIVPVPDLVVNSLGRSLS